MTRLAELFRGGRRLPDPDADLLARFLTDRDEGAFAELVRRHGPGVWGVCRRRLVHSADAEDAFQATFLVLVRRAARVRGHPAVGAWLHRTAVHTANAVRRRNRRKPMVPLTFELPAPSTEPREDVDELLNRLPDKYRLPVVLCHLEGLTRREAAARLGVPEGTLSVRLNRALGRLRAEVAAVAVPAGLSAATVRAAGVYAISAAGPSPAVFDLVREVLRMGRLKPMLTAAVVTLGGLLAVGSAARVATADDPPKPAERRPDPPPAAVPTPPDADLTKLDPEVKKSFLELVPICVAGTVRDGDGNPIPNAVIDKNGTIGYAATYGQTPFNGWARTDAAGRYALWFRTQPDTTVVITALSATADGFVEQRERFRYDELKAHPDRPGAWDFVLARGEILAGVVPEAKGTDHTPLLVRGPSFSRETMLDDEGRFKLWVPKGTYTLTAVLAERRVRRDKKLADTQYRDGPVIVKAATATGVPSGSDKIELK